MRPHSCLQTAALSALLTLIGGGASGPASATSTPIAATDEQENGFIRPTEELPDELPPPAGGLADELLPDDGPRFNRPVRAPGSIPFREGLAALERRAYAKAAVHFQRVLDKFPKSVLAASAEAYLAEIHLWNDVSPQSRADAIGQYRHLVVTYQNNDNTARAYWRIGDLYLGMGLHPEAHGAYTRWLSEGKPGPDTERALLGSGINKLLWGKGAEAADDFDRLRRTTRDERMLRAASVGLADALALQEKRREAHELYEAVYRAWPDELKRRPRSFWSYAQNTEAMGSDAAGRRLYELLYNLHPTHPQAGMVLVRIGDAFRRAQQAGPAALFYGLTLVRHPASEAVSYAKIGLANLGAEAVTRDPEHALATEVRGMMTGEPGPVLDEGTRKKLYRTVADALSTNLLGSEALYRLGELHEASSRLTEAVTVYRELLERRGRVPDDLWPDLGAIRLKGILAPWVVAALQSGDDLTAITLFRQHGEGGEQLYPDGVVPVQVADAYQRLGLVLDAVKLYQAVLKTKASDAVVERGLLGLGRAYEAQDDAAAARHVYQRYRLQFPLAAGRDEALTALIRLAEQEADRSTVMRLSKLWLRDFSDSPKRSSILLSLAEAHLHAGDVDEALRLHASAERLRPSASTRAWLRQADLLATAGHPGEAAKRYQWVILSRPTAEEDAWARVRLASVLRTLNRRTDAAAILAPLRTRNVDPLVSRYSSMLERDLDLGGG